jgi:hypothetical protein
VELVFVLPTVLLYAQTFLLMNVQSILQGLVLQPQTLHSARELRNALFLRPVTRQLVMCKSQTRKQQRVEDAIGEIYTKIRHQ